MADAPPWPNFVFKFAVLACPIIIWKLLLIFPHDFANLLKCHRRSGGTLLHQQCRSLTPQRHHPTGKRGKSGDLHPFNTYSSAQSAVRSPCLPRLGLSTGWDVTLNQLSIEHSAHHMGVTRALAPDDVFEQLHSKACTKAATSHWCVLIQTHI